MTVCIVATSSSAPCTTMVIDASSAARLTVPLPPPPPLLVLLTPERVVKLKCTICGEVLGAKNPSATAPNHLKKHNKAADKVQEGSEAEGATPAVPSGAKRSRSYDGTPTRSMRLFMPSANQIYVFLKNLALSFYTTNIALHLIENPYLVQACTALGVTLPSRWKLVTTMLDEAHAETVSEVEKECAAGEGLACIASDGWRSRVALGGTPLINIMSLYIERAIFRKAVTAAGVGLIVATSSRCKPFRFRSRPRCRPSTSEQLSFTPPPPPSPTSGSEPLRTGGGGSSRSSSGSRSWAPGCRKASLTQAAKVVISSILPTGATAPASQQGFRCSGFHGGYGFGGCCSQGRCGANGVAEGHGGVAATVAATAAATAGPQQGPFRLGGGGADLYDEGAAAAQPDTTRAASGGATPPDSLGDRGQSPTPSGDADDSHGTSSWSGLSGAIARSSCEAQSSHAHDSGSGGGCGASWTSNPSVAVMVEAMEAAAGGGHLTSTSAQEQQQQRKLGQEREPSKTDAAGGTPAVLALCPAPNGEVPEITLAALEDLKGVTAHDFRLLWKHICLQLGVLVAGAEVHGPGSSPYIRLERFLERALSYMDKITLLSPACFVHSMYTNVETGQPERPSDSFWITCARSLQLSPQQLSEVNSLAAVYEQNVIPVVQQRLQLAMQLTSRLGAATGPQRPGSRNGALTAVSTIDELAEQLERNVLKEHQTHWNIGDFLCSSVLTPLQVAKALTVAYPYIPDGVAMLHAFKLINAPDDRMPTAPTGVAANPSGLAGTQQPPSSQSFPSLAGLLASQLPALLMGVAAGGSQVQARVPAGLPLQSGGGAGAVLAKLGTSLPPVQMQQMLVALLQQQQQLQPAQLLPRTAGSANPQPQVQLLKALAAGLQQQGATQLQPLIAGLQAAAAALSAGTQTQPAPGGGLPATGQLQGFASLLDTLASTQQTAGSMQSGAVASQCR
ncbi:hypothetical protein VOLCADRAFT_88957 [Volvox carteri f. nagariensis]|uniref:DUF7963 domain-containing protein n=1 Tax=Volvox carteri f. nagariensis TaxID=3068 RepID=D8TQE9_VOLCA|nr:uncharacterized protein VOLCADRAFT_88957 [Volvox carteri f. nagariensis]EFJ50521.1 hypothetical protein VOLCADRAFT_88957 [Volvox carteri f. nagariensis]|eukprot:XP_002948646.1 hypothetical protein VOLCADRAFT_88957 [Volvox carteri f. nagariensis]